VVYLVDFERDAGDFCLSQDEQSQNGSGEEKSPESF
jgi:hypothetical protein